MPRSSCSRDLGEASHPQSKDDYKTTNYQPGFEDQMLQSYRECKIMKRKRADVLRDAEDKKAHKREANNDDAPELNWVLNDIGFQLARLSKSFHTSSIDMNSSCRFLYTKTS
ncbi:hypothetical protein FRC08_017105 [Ceratobasidium sp. 394]|nr:hypothetical protein FRC08_017105 [Ceratobasidium sp. 394]